MCSAPERNASHADGVFVMCARPWDEFSGPEVHEIRRDAEVEVRGASVKENALRERLR
jgi:hypothetical protein